MNTTNPGDEQGGRPGGQPRQQTDQWWSAKNMPPAAPLPPPAPKPVHFWGALNEESAIRKPMTLDQRIRRLEVDTAAIIRGLNGISGSAVCNEDGTITFTITIPGIPG